MTSSPKGFRARARLCLPDLDKFDAAAGKEVPGPVVYLEAASSTEQDAVSTLMALVGPRIAKHLRQHQQAQELLKGRTRRAQAGTSQTVAEAAAAVVSAQLGDSEIAATSANVYELHIRKHLVKAPLGQTPIGQVGPEDVSQYLKEITRSVGSASAKSGRAILSKTFGVAVRQGHLRSNPVRDAGIIRRTQSSRLHHLSHDRALSEAERAALALAVETNQTSVSLDVTDLVLAGMTIGARIGELIALRWCDVEFTDDGLARVTLDGTVSSVREKGLVRTKPKTAYSVRTIPVPSRTAALLRRRAEKVQAGPDDTRPVFPAPGVASGASWRDPSNTAKTIRKVFDESGYEWLSFYGLRRSAITVLADKLGIRVAADYAGHASIRTARQSYIGRGKVADEVAGLL